MSLLPNSDYDKIRIYPNEYVTNGTINRGVRRLLENDTWLEDHISGAVSASTIMNALSAEITAVGVETDDVYSTVAANSGTWSTGSQGDVAGPATNHNSYVPQWDGANSKLLKDGLPVGNGAGALVARTNVNTLAADALVAITTNGSVTVGGLAIKNAAPYLGSDAVGDIWFRGGLGMSRLPLGSNGQVLTVSTITSQPVWAGLPNLTSVYSTVQSGSASWTTAGNYIGTNSSNITLKANTFNGANQLVELTSSGYLPALNGSALTNLNAGNISNGVLSASRGGAGASNGILYANGSGVVNSVTVSGELVYSAGVLSAPRVYVENKTSGFVMSSSDLGKLVLFESSTPSGQIMNLIAAPSNGSLTVRIKNESTNVVTLSGDINGTTSYGLSGSTTLISDGSTWHTF